MISIHSWLLSGQEENGKGKVLGMFKGVGWHPASAGGLRTGFTGEEGSLKAGLKGCRGVNFQPRGLKASLGHTRSP